MIKSRIILFTIFFCAIATVTSAQKLKSVTASNGYLIEEGDTVMLGVGSATDGFFNYVYSSSANSVVAAFVDEDEYDFRLPEFFQGAPVVIYKIKVRNNDTLLYFETESWGDQVINLEQAIDHCEIAFCRPDGFLSQEIFEKLILLYRAVQNEEITEERFWELRGEMLN